MTSDAASEAEALPIPEDFPVVWADPADAQRAWRQDAWHWPEVAAPLASDVWELAFSGNRRAVVVTGRPAGGMSRRINGYQYNTRIRVSMETWPPIGTEPQPAFEENHRTWDEVWLPQVQAYLARWEQFDREGADATAMLAHLDEALRWYEHCYEMHFRLNFRGRWVAWCAEQLGWEAERARELVAGEPNKSTEGDAALRVVADVVRGSAVLRAAFERPAGEVLAALPDDGDGARFRAALAGYLDVFGRRSDRQDDVAFPSWREEPTPVIALVKMYALQPARDFEAEQAAMLARRDAAAASARAEVLARSAELAAVFDWELAHGRRCAALSEDHNYWLDQQVAYWMRQDLLACGRLLAAQGVIAGHDDVFLLTLDELRAALGSEGNDRRSLVAARRAELAHWATITPPAELGVREPAAVAAALDPIRGGAAGSTDAGQVRGQPASRGVVTGRARLIATLAEADRLQPGEVLVTKTTSPPWTPLFGVASAVVTDAGGALSHVAVVAREYGIPAVVGAVNATSRIRDGQMVRVDGSAGTVDLLGSE